MDRNKQALELIKKNKLEDAVQLITEHIEENPNDPLGYINFGNLLMHMKDLARAETFFERAIELDKQAATAYYGLGTVYYENDLFSKAQENFNKAIELGLQDSDAYYMLGMSFLSLEHLELATPYLLRATELDSEDEEKLFQYGLALAQSNYLSEAKDVFIDVLKRNVNHSDAHYNLGVISSYENDFKKGLYYFKEALTIQPDHVLAANGKRSVEEILNKKET